MSKGFLRRTVLKGLGAAALPPALLTFPAGGSSGRRIPFGLRPADPLVMVAEDGTLSGLEYEIIVAAMAVPGHEVVPYLGPNARLTQALFRAAVDAIAPAVALGGTQFTLSDPYLSYRNVAITLAKDKVRVDSVADLVGRKVAAFQRAREALGTAYSGAVAGTASYREEGQQHRQALALLYERADVIIGDRRILMHHIRRVMEDGGFWTEVTVHPIFPSNDYPAAFRDRSIAADFNQGLAAIKADGTYQTIMARYAMVE